MPKRSRLEEGFVCSQCNSSNVRILQLETHHGKVQCANCIYEWEMTLEEVFRENFKRVKRKAAEVREETFEPARTDMSERIKEWRTVLERLNARYGKTHASGQEVSTEEPPFSRNASSKDINASSTITEHPLKSYSEQALKQPFHLAGRAESSQKVSRKEINANNATNTITEDSLKSSSKQSLKQPFHLAERAESSRKVSTNVTTSAIAEDDLESWPKPALKQRVQFTEPPETLEYGNEIVWSSDSEFMPSEPEEEEEEEQRPKKTRARGAKKTSQKERYKLHAMLIGQIPVEEEEPEKDKEGVNEKEGESTSESEDDEVREYDPDALFSDEEEDKPAKRRRRKKEIDDERRKNPHAVFRPRPSNKFNPFFIFNKQVRADICAKHPNLSNAQISRLVSEAYKQLSQEERDKLKKEALAKKKELNEARGRRSRNERVPGNGFIYFSRETQRELRKEHPEYTMKDVNAVVSRKWKELSKEEKDKYNEYARELRQKFIAENPEYFKKWKDASLERRRRTLYKKYGIAGTPKDLKE